MSRDECGQILLSEPEQTHCRRQTPAMLRVRWVFESLLKMNESAGRLDQAFEVIRITRFRFQPKLLENVMSFVITLWVSAMEKRVVNGLVCNISHVQIEIVTTQIRYKVLSPRAHVHGARNL